MTRRVNQVSHVKVKTAELKTHLSHYLRVLQEGGEDIEVCLREQPVAYLSRRKDTAMTTKNTEELSALRQRFLAAGLVWRGIGSNNRTKCSPLPMPTPDGRADVDSVLEMRRQRDW